MGFKFFLQKPWLPKNDWINLYRPSNNINYKQAFNNVNYNKLKEIKEEKNQTQEFGIEFD